MYGVKICLPIEENAGADNFPLYLRFLLFAFSLQFAEIITLYDHVSCNKFSV